MGWRFRKSFKILPGVRLNITQKGVTSATLGKRGLSMSVGKSGVHQNAGIPGTGLSYRTKIAGAASSIPVLLGGILGVGFLLALIWFFLMFA